MANVVAAAKGAKEQSEISAGGNGRSRFGMLWKKAALQIKIDCTNAKPKLVDEAPAWWPVPDRARVAADSFDRQYKTSVARAERVFHRLDAASSEAESRVFGAALLDVNQLRFLPPDRAGLLQTPRGPGGRTIYSRGASAAPSIVDEATEVEFDVTKSIWAPRAKWADSKSVYDTEAVLAARFTNDWNRALELGIVNMVTKYDDDAALDDDGDGVPDEVVEVGTVLWENAELYFVIFSYYAALGGDVYSLSLNEWSRVLDDFGLVQKRSEWCKRADMDRVFLAVDAASTALEKKRKVALGGGFLRAASSAATTSHHEDVSKALNRVEFVTALVTIAINRYVRSTTKLHIADVSEALKRLLEVDIQSRFSPTLLAEPNAFRREFCYTVGVNKVLRRHEVSLRQLFEVAGASEAGVDASDALMSLAEWKLAVRGLALIDDDLSDRDATLCFVWSRMAVCDGRTAKGHLKESHLPFEGFLEGLCRLAALKALPTDAEIANYTAADAEAAVDVVDAESYLQQLRVDGTYRDFLLERANKWGARPRQAFERCVAHLVDIVVARVRRAGAPASGTSSSSTAAALTRRQVERWAKSEIAAFAKFAKKR